MLHFFLNGGKAEKENLHRYVDLLCNMYKRLKRESKQDEGMKKLPKLRDREEKNLSHSNGGRFNTD